MSVQEALEEKKSIHSEEVMTENKSSVFFNSFAEDFDSIYENKRGPLMRWVDLKFRSDMYIRFRKTFESFGDLNGKTVLDIGCGSGVYAAECFQRGAVSVTGVDHAPNMLELVKKRLQSLGKEDNCALVVGSFPDVEAEPHDHAIVMGVMDYIEDTQRFLDKLRPLVKISAAVSFPSKHWLRTPLRKFRYNLRNCPLYFHDEAQIVEMCKKAGFSSVSVDKIPGAGMDYHVTLSA